MNKIVITFFVDGDPSLGLTPLLALPWLSDSACLKIYVYSALAMRAFFRCLIRLAPCTGCWRLVRFRWSVRETTRLLYKVSGSKWFEVDLLYVLCANIRKAIPESLIEGIKVGRHGLFPLLRVMGWVVCGFLVHE